MLFLSVRLYDDFMFLEPEDQREMLLFETNVMEWPEEQLRKELESVRPTYELLCTLANEELNERERVRLLYHSRRMDLKMAVIEDELTRRELR